MAKVAAVLHGLVLCGLIGCLASGAWGQMLQMPSFPQPAAPDEPEVSLDLADVTVKQALAELSRASGYLFLADPQVAERKITLQHRAQPLALLIAVAIEAEARPVEAVLFCSEDQAPAKEPKFDLPDRPITLAVTDLDTPAVLLMLSTVAKIKLAATEELLRKAPAKLSLALDNVPAEQAAQRVAQALGAKAARGLCLVPSEAQQAFDAFMNLAPQEQERLLVAGARQWQQQGLSPQEVERRWREGLQYFWQLPPHQRQRLVGRLAAGVNRLAERMQQFSPQARAELGQMWKPVIERGIAVFLSLPTEKQSELAPAIQALQRLPLGW
jgi:hypothetical protein